MDADPAQRRRSLVRWLKRLNDTLKMHHQTYEILDRYPKLPKKINNTTNRAFASFLKAYMAPSVITVLAGIDPNDGLGIISRLQQLYASATLEDKLRAQDYLQNLQMHPKELITSFISRFRRAIQGIYDASQDPEPLPELYLINLFLVKTLNTIQTGSDIRNTLLDYKRMLKRAKDTNCLPFTLAEMEYEVSQQENNAKMNTRITASRKESANVATTSSMKRKPIKCFFCGGNHWLSECRKCTKEEKKKLWDKHGNKSKRRKPTRISSANAATTSKTKSESASSSPPQKPEQKMKKEVASTAVRITNSSRPKVTFASMAKAVSIKDQTATEVPLNSSCSFLSQSLIDSGCSTHMTPFAQDLLMDHESTEAVVEVANGNIVKAAKRGTALVRIVDVDTQNAYDIYLEGVLHVPGISRRLFSVTCWTQCGGSISFHGEKCQLSYEDPSSSSGKTTATILAPFTEYPAPGHYIHPIASAGQDKIEIPSELLHRRLGHRSYKTWGVANEYNLWHDAKATLKDDKFCWGCDITFSKKARRGKSALSDDSKIKPGSCLMIDLQTNPSRTGLTRATHFPYYLQITDALTRFTVLLGLPDKEAHSVWRCLHDYSLWFKANPEFNAYGITQVHGDFDTVFKSEEFRTDCKEHNMKVTTAAPRHQEMNGICERQWANIRNIAFSFLVHARVGMEYFDLALEHAWKIHAVLPIKNLTHGTNIISPYEYFFGQKPCIRKFRVPFCPCVMNTGPQTDRISGKVTSRSNHPERGIRGIHVGLPRGSAGWMVYVPSTGQISISQDVIFDEDFLSTVAYSKTSVPGGLVLKPTSQSSFSHQNLETTENPSRFAINEVAPGIPDNESDEKDKPTFIPQFQPTDGPTNHSWPQEPMPELHDNEFCLEGENINQNHKNKSIIKQKQNKNRRFPHAPRRSKRLIKDKAFQVLEATNLDKEWMNQLMEPLDENRKEILCSLGITMENPTLADYYANVTIEEALQQEEEEFCNDLTNLTTEEQEFIAENFDDTVLHNCIDEYCSEHDTNSSHQHLQAFNTTASTNELSLNDLHHQVRYSYQTEVQSVEGATAEDFLPAPNHWKQITRMPERQKQPWLRSLKAELDLLINKMKVFEPIKPNEDDPIIPTTTKFRTKIKPDGTVEKLKARICLRGDQQEKDNEYDTWCKIGGFNAVKHFLALAAHHKCRVYQLDYTGAFLQAPATTRVITILPAEWKEFFPDLAEYFGVPLLILKSLYGQTQSMKIFDIRQSDWLVNDYGFTRCPSEESIYHYHHNGHFIYMNNVVDDQLYFSNYDPLRKDFEKKISTEFLVELMGQAHWYLQARVRQLSNFSITLDQSRYMALISSRFLPEYPTNNITSEDKARYTSPLPQSFVPTKEQQSKTYSEVKDLEAKYGFQY